jgi:hypothetical protein
MGLIRLPFRDVGVSNGDGDDLQRVLEQLLHLGVSRGRDIADELERLTTRADPEVPARALRAIGDALGVHHVGEG